MLRDHLHFSINGKAVKLGGESAFLPLSDVLRYELGLTGTKVVCAEGDCGACTVMYRRLGGAGFASLNSCISSAILLDGCHLITVEGMSETGKTNEIQASMIRNFGGQCGFCTPGFVMSIVNMYERKGDPSEQNVKNYLTGNLCRCTGYSPIIQAALDVDVKKLRPLEELYNFAGLTEKMNADLQTPIKITWQDKEFFAPLTLATAAEYRAESPGVRIFSGATDLGVQINKGRDPGAKRMSLHLVKELYQLEEKSGWIRVGARVNLAELEKFLEPRVPKFAEFLGLFASPQIKNTATLIGNIANGSPIADTTPFLMTADAEVELFGVNGRRTVPLVNFFKGYKTFDLQADEVISHIRFRRPGFTEKIGLYKVSQRRDLDISCVNSSFIFDLEGKKVKTAKISFGGVGSTAVRLPAVEKFLEGKELNRELVERAKQRIDANIRPISDVRGTEDFRRLIAQDLLEKYVRENFRDHL